MRLLNVFGVTSEAIISNDSAPNTFEASFGMMNLSKMRVEDVAVPTAEIVSVPDTISKADLVEVFVKVE